LSHFSKGKNFFY